MFWLIAKPSTWFLQKFTQEPALMHRDFQSHPQAVLDLVSSVSGTSRNITTDNYYTSIPLAKELKSRKLNLVGTMKKNKAHIPPSFLAKADEGTVQYAFDHANNFTLLSVAPKKNKRIVFLSTIDLERKRDEDTGKEEINVFYNHEKGGVDSHDQMCSLYTTARKNKPLANEALLWNN